MNRQFVNHYATLGVHSAATAEEIRRAYRILARRYHPDMNPGKDTGERFRRISDAYRVLSDVERRRQFDLEFEAQLRQSERETTYQRPRGRPNRRVNPQASEPRPGREFEGGSLHRDSARERYQRFRTEYARAAAANAAFKAPDSASAPGGGNGGPSLDLPKQWLAQLGKSLRRWRKAEPAQQEVSHINRVSIIEVSVSMRDAIFGVKKSVELDEPEGMRKISVRIPPGVRNGSVVRLRAKNSGKEELVLIVRVAAHPLLSMQPKGLVVEVPITVQEAIVGASITVPTLEDAVVLKVPPGSQSGQELRVKGKGVVSRDGERGDLFVRLMIRVPESPEAVGIKEKAAELEQYYAQSVRQPLPKSLSEV